MYPRPCWRQDADTVTLISQPAHKKGQVTVKENLIGVKCRLWLISTVTWLLEATQFKELPICIARVLAAPRNQNVPIRIVNLDPLPVTVYKNTKIATAELITDRAICNATESEEPTTDLDVFLQPLPHVTKRSIFGIDGRQKSQGSGPDPSNATSH